MGTALLSRRFYSFLSMPSMAATAAVTLWMRLRHPGAAAHWTTTGKAPVHLLTVICSTSETSSRSHMVI